MKKIKILGTGCPKCLKLENLTRVAAEEMNIEFNIEKVTDIKAIMDYGVMMTPALIVDGKVKSVGKIPEFETLKRMLS